MLQKHRDLPRSFKVPYINGRFILPLLFGGCMLWLITREGGWLSNNANPFRDVSGLPMFLFFVVFGLLSVAAFFRNLSLIPVAGILTCLYLMAQIHIDQWVGFGVWLVTGLIIYFAYGYRNSRLRKS